jgi:2,3-bisphosphoglycerate-independent phosphoglycerate mutase
MADEPVEQLGGKTPLETAKTPQMDRLAREGRLGLARTIPQGMTASREVAAMNLLGYDPRSYYPGRGPLEAAYWGVPVQPGDLIFRCNLVTVDEQQLIDDMAGRISSEESAPLMELIGKQLNAGGVQFFNGRQYRHAVVFRAPEDVEGLRKTVCRPAYEMAGQPLEKNWPKGPAAQRLKELMLRSRDWLAAHEINQVRVDLNENPANMVWLWGQGVLEPIPSFKERWNKKGVVVSGSDSIKGAGRAAGLRVEELPPPSGNLEIDHSHRADAAIRSLTGNDLIFVHAEAAHAGIYPDDLRQKISAIELFDRVVVGPVVEKARGLGPVRVMVGTDHPVLIEKRIFNDQPVPLVVWGDGIPAGSAEQFSEAQAKSGGWMVESPHGLMPRLLAGETIV